MPYPATPEEIRTALCAPFPRALVGCKPITVKNGKALIAWYIDARAVEDRLDDVLGPFGWEDEYTESLAHNIVKCTLWCYFGDRRLKKEDVGVLMPGDVKSGNADMKYKGVYSDALKRAAVKWGVGRYLYDIPNIWCPYDEQKKRFIGDPVLPARFLPHGDQSGPGPQSPPDAGAKKSRPQLPQNGTELIDRLNAYDAKCSSAGLFAQGDLIRYVNSECGKSGLMEVPVPDWNGEAIAFAVKTAQAFEASCRAQKATPQPASAPPQNGAGRNPKVSAEWKDKLIGLCGKATTEQEFDDIATEAKNARPVMTPEDIQFVRTIYGSARAQMADIAAAPHPSQM